MNDCGWCEESRPACVRVDCMTEDGEATWLCCLQHLEEAYWAALLVGDEFVGAREPVLTLLDGARVALVNLRCPGCGRLMTMDHGYAKGTEHECADRDRE